MEILTGKVSRILYAIPMLMFGVNHFMMTDMMAASMLDGWPGAKLIVIVTGVALISAAISIAINKKAKLAGILLGLMLLTIALTIHLPNMMAGGEDSTPMIMMMKDIGLAGGALAFAHFSS